MDDKSTSQQSLSPHGQAIRAGQPPGHGCQGTSVALRCVRSVSTKRVVAPFSPFGRGAVAPIRHRLACEGGTRHGPSPATQQAHQDAQGATDYTPT
jgi:hypothetical protein